MSERQRPITQSVGEQALSRLIADAQLAPPHELAGLIDRCAQELGARSAVAYLVDLQQQVLSPFVSQDGPGEGLALAPLEVDGTMAGRAYQSFEMQSQDGGSDGVRVWIPLLVGTDRLGVLSVAVADATTLQGESGPLSALLARFALIAAELLEAKSPYGDTLIRLRRRTEMGLAAEIQWSLLPPLTFVSRPVTVAAALEPAYHVAGDTVDYSVDAGRTRVAVFDVMGHGLQSAQCAVLAVAAYRNARRSGRTLIETLQSVDEALLAGVGGEVYATAVVAELATDTGLLQWVNAGHPEPLLLRGGRLIKTLHVEHSPPIGLGELRDTEPITVGIEQLEPGDRVLLYTDGVVEARSPSGEFFGTERLADLILRHLAGGLPAPETMRRVVRELLEHHQDQLSDDASLLLLEWRSGNEEALTPS